MNFYRVTFATDGIGSHVVTGLPVTQSELGGYIQALNDSKCVVLEIDRFLTDKNPLPDDYLCSDGCYNTINDDRIGK